MSPTSTPPGPSGIWAFTATTAIFFVKDDIVINEVELQDIDSYLERISAEENHCCHYLLIHEQYFYEDYRRCEPDYRERIFRCVA